MSATTHRLDEVCRITMGQAPSGDAYNFAGQGWPLIAGAGDLRDGILCAKKSTTESPKLSAPGDIVLCIRASIGAKAWSDKEYCLGRGVAGLRPRTGLDPEYLWHWLGHTTLALTAKGRGATFKQVNREDIGEMPIVLPALEEQQRIAAILKQAELLCAKTQHAILQIDDLSRSVFLKMFGDPGTKPSSAMKRLGDVVTIGTGSTPSRAVPDNYGGMIPWVKTGELTGGRITRTGETISELGRRSANCRIYPAGSIIVALYGQGQTRGRSGVLDIEAATNQACAVLLPSANYETDFLFTQLKLGYKRLRAMARGGNQPNLNLSLVSDFRVVMAPLSEQRLFTRRLAHIQALSKKQSASLALRNELCKSLKDLAFSGRL